MTKSSAGWDCGGGVGHREARVYAEAHLYTPTTATAPTSPARPSVMRAGPGPLPAKRHGAGPRSPSEGHCHWPAPRVQSPTDGSARRVRCARAAAARTASWVAGDRCTENTAAPVPSRAFSSPTYSTAVGASMSSILASSRVVIVCLLEVRRSAPVVFHAVTPHSSPSMRVAITVMTKPASRVQPTIRTDPANDRGSGSLILA